MFGNRSCIRKEGHRSVQRIDNLSGNRSSVYLRNYFFDIYGTTFWRYKELFLSRVFVELALKKDEVYILRVIAIAV